jgi:uncharacterized membrane protein
METSATMLPTQSARRARSPGHWPRLFLAILAGTGLLILLLPGMRLEWKLSFLLHGICGQQHNLVLGGVQLPLCARDSGMYLSVLATLGVIRWRGRGRAGRIPPWPILFILLGLVLLMAVDGINSTLAEMGRAALYLPRDDLRVATGMGMGIGLAVMLSLIVNLTFRRDIEDHTPILGWPELGMIFALNGLLFAALIGGFGLASWPTALLVTLTAMGTLTTCFMVIIGALLGYEGSVTELRQLARPATYALLLALSVLLGLALLRVLAEAYGLLPPPLLPQ